MQVVIFFYYSSSVDRQTLIFFFKCRNVYIEYLFKYYSVIPVLKLMKESAWLLLTMNIVENKVKTFSEPCRCIRPVLVPCFPGAKRKRVTDSP